LGIKLTEANRNALVVKIAEGLQSTRYGPIFIPFENFRWAVDLHSLLSDDDVDKLCRYCTEEGLQQLIYQEIYTKTILEGIGQKSDYNGKMISEIPEYSNTLSLAGKIVSKLESLPHRYRMTVALPTSLSNPIIDQIPSPYNLSNSGIIARGGDLPGPPALRSDNENVDHWLFRDIFTGEEMEREWFNDRLYLSMMVLGYGTPSSASSLARLFEDYIKAFFGAGIALGLFRRGRSAMDQQSRLPFITVHAGDGSNEIIDTEKLEQEILEAGYSLGTSDWLDANKDHPWVNLRVILDTISTVFHENKDCRKLFTACIWHYRSVLNKRPLDRLLESTISIEVLLGDRKASEGIGLTKLLSNRCAFLLGISSRSRERILELFEKIYTLRSAVVHEGRHKLGPGEIKIVNAAVELCGSIIRKEMHIRNEPGKDR